MDGPANLPIVFPHNHEGATDSRAHSHLVYVLVIDGKRSLDHAGGVAERRGGVGLRCRTASTSFSYSSLAAFPRSSYACSLVSLRNNQNRDTRQSYVAFHIRQFDPLFSDFPGSLSEGARREVSGSPSCLCEKTEWSNGSLRDTRVVNGFQVCHGVVILPLQELASPVGSNRLIRSMGLYPSLIGSCIVEFVLRGSIGKTLIMIRVLVIAIISIMVNY